jgi:hypothetical protein
MRITRRDLLKYIGASVLGTGLSFDWGNRILNKYQVHQIYHELSEHVHLAKTITNIEKMGESDNYGCGIILNGKYLTMAHIITSHATSPCILKKSLTAKNRKTILYGKELEQHTLDTENDVAIFNLPPNLQLPDFPAKPSKEINRGEDIYIIGNPFLTGSNIRAGHISDLGKSKNYFGIDIGVIFGDSGCPVVNSDFKLLGLTESVPFVKFPILGNIKKIEEYLKHI